MNSRKLFFSGLLLFAPTIVYGACSVANLTRCLDSVCAINIGSNPGARCQYCGVGTIDTSKKNTMKTVAVGAAAKYTLSDKELKNAPTDAGQRYVWATKLCLEKLPDCTTDDVDDNYDKLIEQSCTAANISMETNNLAQKSNAQKKQSSCATDITTCVVDKSRCGGGYAGCINDSDFDKYFSQCSIESTGCESFLSDIRSQIAAERTNAITNADNILNAIVQHHKSERENKLTSIQQSCKNNTAKQECIDRVCRENLPNHCGIEMEIVAVNATNNDIIRVETTIAETLCKYYDTACERLK